MHVVAWVDLVPAFQATAKRLTGKTGEPHNSKLVHFLERLFRGSIDVQVGRGETCLLRYVTGYVAKTSDALNFKTREAESAGAFSDIEEAGEEPTLEIRHLQITSEEYWISTRGAILERALFTFRERIKTRDRWIELLPEHRWDVCEMPYRNTCAFSITNVARLSEPVRHLRILVLQTDGRGLVLKYVATYVPKFSDSFANEWLDDDSSDYHVAKKILFDYHPQAPEMWLQLAAQQFPQF